ncbi:Multiple resistance and pH homeostasis protein B [uncultured Roseburia sp.]|uniref:Na+/H+ antiporter MnhB subunit-related protein domain-containing protein n=1 Tax=Brotonthovivens ammoniilytica TaxID=2981725 RepID=A0ABT2TLQ1_9FIRM|nr:MnhB domain-containing protein [Brotonthovivens ammoniilytica]MCU6763135.1 hypothetical protein [Brotonthovivens ammoniilytica]SCJ04368.1 Multiple resistance and pH homeostasis protein B [uncultured Roseburia sp.]
MKKRFGGTILDISTRLIIPFSMMYAIYVLAAGELGPGGGFQAGAVLALGIVFSRLVKGKNSFFSISGTTAAGIAGLGAFLYCFTGWLTFSNGGQFLEYGHLPFKWLDYVHLHELGIFLIEAGVTICVMMTITTILEALLKREDFEDHD